MRTGTVATSANRAARKRRAPKTISKLRSFKGRTSRVRMDSANSFRQPSGVPGYFAVGERDLKGLPKNILISVFGRWRPLVSAEPSVDLRPPEIDSSKSGTNGTKSA